MLKFVWRVYQKELTETLRDKRTLIVMILLPLSLYPLIGIGFSQYASVRKMAHRQELSRVAICGARWSALALKLHHPKMLLYRTECKTARTMLRDGKRDLVVEVPAGAARRSRERRSVRLVLRYDETRARSRQALGRARRVIAALDRELLHARLAAENLSPQFARPTVVKEASVATRRQVGSFILAQALPLLVVLMVLLGAFYPAIDLTAGEKERGTLEALLVTPIPRFALIGGKFLAVTTIAVITGVLNLGSIGLTLALGFGAALEGAGVAVEIPWTSLLMTLFALLPAAAFFSALMVAVAALARSFKEAQNLLTPVYLVCMVPAMVAQFPEVGLDLGTAMIPALNVSLVTRDLIAGKADVLLVTLALLATSIHAVFALLAAARIFNSERLLFASDRPLFAGSLWGTLIGGRKETVDRGKEPMTQPDEQPSASGQQTNTPSIVEIRENVAEIRENVAEIRENVAEIRENVAEIRENVAPPIPSLGSAGVLLMLVLALTILVGSPLQAKDLVSGLLVTEWLLVALPVVLAIRLSASSARATLSLYPARPLNVIGALLAGLSGWYVVSLLVEHVQQQFLPMPKEFIEAMKQLLSGQQRALWVDVLVIAVSPAICEELLFRGYLLRASRSLGAITAITANAVLFGIFHLSIYRFFPTALLGAALATITFRTRSLWPAMLFHALNNSMAMVMVRYGPEDTLSFGSSAANVAGAAGMVALFTLGVFLATRVPTIR
jgi:sodium transport system permease protein